MNPIHTIPLDDLREHTCAPDCWCEPTEEVDGELFVHHSMDRREEYERGERKPS